MKKLLFICSALMGLCVMGCETTTGQITTVTPTTDLPQAFREVMNSYYMRGSHIQVNTMKVANFPPEDASPQNTNYMVCSGFTGNVYNEMLKIKIPPYTASLLKYSRERVGSPEVIAYGNKDAAGNLVMRFYKPDGENNSVILTNPSLTDILPYLRCGDILTYTGHAVLVYDLIRDGAGNITDAYIMQTGFRFGRNYVISKISHPVSIKGKMKFGSRNHYLYYNKSSDVSTWNNEKNEGCLNLKKLTAQRDWANINTPAGKNEYSILRFVEQDDKGNLMLTYHGAEYGDRNHDREIVRLPAKSADRVKFDRLYIEKTVDVFGDNIVEEKDRLTYRITVKNNSSQNYKEDIRVRENVSDYVTYHDFRSGKPGIIVNRQQTPGERLEWNIGKLQSGETVTLEYTVTVKENCHGKTIESAGMAENIPLPVIRNRIGTNLSQDQARAVAETYESLRTAYTGKELINEIYRQALGTDLQLTQFDITDLIVNTDPQSLSSKTISLNKNNPFYSSVLNKYWSALYQKDYNYQGQGDVREYELKTWRPYTSPVRRADTVYSQHFRTGDILVYKNSNDMFYNYTKNTLTKTPVTYENGEYAYIFIEGKGFVGINYGNDGIPGTADDRNEFNASYYDKNGLKVYSDINETEEKVLEFANYQTLFGKDYYVILRPSLGLVTASSSRL